MSLFPEQEGTYHNFSVFAPKERMDQINETFDYYPDEIEEVTGISQFKIKDRELDELEYKLCVFACYILWNKWDMEQRKNESSDHSPFEDNKGDTR